MTGPGRTNDAGGRAADLPAGEFDVLAGIRLEKVDELLAAAYTSYAWPHVLPPGTASEFLGVLRDLSDDVPDGDDIQIGAVRFTAPATTAAGPQATVRIEQVIRVDVDAVRITPPLRSTVIALTVIVRFDARPTADESDTEPGCLRIRLDTATGPLGTDEVDIAPGSAIQPRDAEALEMFRSKLAFLFLDIRAAVATYPIAVGPDIRLPFAPAAQVRIMAGRAGTRTTDVGKGALYAGALIGFGEDPPHRVLPDLSLPTDPFGRSTITVLVTIHQATLQTAADVLTTTLAQKIADKVPLFTVDIDRVTVDLRPPDQIRVVATIAIRNYCGPGPANFFDLHADLLLTTTVRALAGEINLSGTTQVDFDNTDLIRCAISVPVDVVTLDLPGWWSGLLLTGAVVLLPFVDLSAAGGFNGIVDPRAPIPYTEVTPLIETLQVLVSTDRITLRGDLTLLPAEDYLFGYVIVREDLAFGRLPGPPVPGVLVELCDQDAPVPASDDTPPPVLQTPVIRHGRTRTVRQDLWFEAAARDETVAAATTDRFGIARLVAARATAGGNAGTVVIRQTVYYHDRERNPEVSILRAPVRETNPDVYLRATLRNGRQVDSRTGAGLRIAVNLDAGRFGAPEAPVMLLVPRDIGAPAGPGATPAV